MDIVILEDEGIMAMFLEDTAKSLGHNVKACFANATSFYEFIKDTSVDLVFLDILIKGPIDGIEVAKELRRKNENVKIVFVTSYKDSETILEAKEAKPDGYLIKPITKENLEAILMICESNFKKDTQKENSTLIPLSSYIYDFKNTSISENNKIINLTKKETLCLNQLVLNRNSYISHENLILTIWGNDTSKSINSLRELVYRLRKKLPMILIENSVNIGYILKEETI